MKVRIKHGVDILALIASLLIFAWVKILFFSVDRTDIFFKIDTLSKFISLGIAFFGVITILYSITAIRYYLNTEEKVIQYYVYTLLTVFSSIGAVLANHFVIFMTFWGITGLLLYLMINLVSEGSTAAKKSFVIIGGSDAFMILGFEILWFATNNVELDLIKIDMNQIQSGWCGIAFLCLLVGSLAKAGAIPLHTWIPDMAEKSPTPITAFLPASLDKLLGIYFLTRLCLNIFTLNAKFTTVLMVIGAVTIIAGVFMAMVQHEFKKLLAYHAVSQIGYMVLGIATGNPIGIAGGLFHMINNAIYKSCLFLTSGAVEQKNYELTNNKTSELESFGGMGRIMPITFLGFLIAALSISGVPPFNGFVSKWMVYQGIIDKLQITNYKLQIVYGLCLIAAMFGSALTLASFIKLTHAMFLGQRSNAITQQRNTEVHWTMWLPTSILAVLCVIFGIFAFQVPLKLFIFPSLPTTYYLPLATFTGLWQPELATLLVILGLIIGMFIYLILNIKVRVANTYLLGELKPDHSKISGTEFYDSIKEIPSFNLIYFLAEKKLFDIYSWGKTIVSGIGSKLSFFHNGNLHFYLSWVILGLVILFLIL